jgi:hypothetical protein
MNSKFLTILLTPIVMLISCKKDHEEPMPKDPNTAEVASIDRFSSVAGHLQVRTATNGLPAANAPVDFDRAPFITTGLSSTGQSLMYYNFDVQPTTPAPIWVLFKNGATNPVDGQLNIIDVIPGDANYNDFWQVYKVTVPDDYVANTVTNYSEIIANGYTITTTPDLVNCPVVPQGSTATKRFNASENAGLTKGWYKGKLVFYFNFAEKMLSATASNLVPLSDIYVTFNINPDQTGGGPESGFKTESGNDQTHNVVVTIPTNASYSPLWTVKVYNNTSFGNVNNLTTATAAPLLAPDAGKVNCPVVHIQ